MMDVRKSYIKVRQSNVRSERIKREMGESLDHVWEVWLYKMEIAEISFPQNMQMIKLNWLLVFMSKDNHYRV